MIVVRLAVIGRDYETTEEDSGEVVLDGIGVGWAVAERVVEIDGETEAEDDSV